MSRLQRLGLLTLGHSFQPTIAGINKTWAEDVALLVAGLPTMNENMGSFPTSHKQGIVVHAYDLNTTKTEARGLKFQGQDQEDGPTGRVFAPQVGELESRSLESQDSHGGTHQ